MNSCIHIINMTSLSSRFMWDLGGAGQVMRPFKMSCKVVHVHNVIFYRSHFHLSNVVHAVYVYG